MEMGNRTVLHFFSRDFKIDRGAYLGLGLILCAVKYSIDYSVAQFVFHRFWSPWDYLVSGATLSTILQIPDDRTFFLTMFGLSIPFVTVGVILTLARLRSAGLGPMLVLLFFLPVLNLIAFLILSVLEPSSQYVSDEIKPLLQDKTDSWVEGVAPPALVPLAYGTDQPTARQQFISRFFPVDARASLFVAVALTVPIVVVTTWASVYLLSSYGWGIFVAMPFIGGILSSMMHGMRMRRSLAQCLGAAILSTIVSVSAILLFGIDGLVCLIMFLPLAIPLGCLGAAVGYSLQPGSARQGNAGETIGALILFLPIFLGSERLAHPIAPVYAATTSVEINASPQRVWEYVVSFSEIPPPTDWVFKSGVAYPLHASIDGQGVGAIRHCVFSTGEFTEPITVWDEPRLLKFDVTSNPPAMKEWSPYDIHPPHVHDFLISHGGQFRLIPLANGRTRLEGTTWYEHNLWPAAYWRIWSDFIIHHIHRRVLEHVKQLAEAA